MRPGREIDARVAQEIFGYEVWAKNKVLHERTEKGERPLRPYSKEMTWAWEVAAKMRVSIIPIDEKQWFAFAGDMKGWESPEHFLQFLREGDFRYCGAAVGENPAQTICEAALNAHQKMTRPHLVREENSTPVESPAPEGAGPEMTH